MPEWLSRVFRGLFCMVPYMFYLKNNTTRKSRKIKSFHSISPVQILNNYLRIFLFWWYQMTLGKVFCRYGSTDSSVLSARYFAHLFESHCFWNHCVKRGYRPISQTTILFWIQTKSHHHRTQRFCCTITSGLSNSGQYFHYYPITKLFCFRFSRLKN